MLNNILLYGSIVMAALNVVSLWLLSDKRRWGWLATVAMQCLWIPYDVITRQYGFIALSVAILWISARGWRQWRKDDCVQIVEGAKRR